MKRRMLAKEAADKEFNKFIQLLKSAKAMPSRGKPSECSWKGDEKIWHRIESLEAFAIDACKDDGQKNTAGAVILLYSLCFVISEILEKVTLTLVFYALIYQILKAMGLARTSDLAVQLLIDIGYFPVHVNLDLLKFNIRTNYPDHILSAAERLLQESPDPDKVLSFLPL